MDAIFIVFIIFFAIFGLRPTIQYLRERERLRYGSGPSPYDRGRVGYGPTADPAELDLLRQAVTDLSDQNLELTRRMQRLESMMLSERKATGSAAPPIDLSALGTEMSPEGDLTRSRQRLG